MGVMRCSKISCGNIMCDTYIPEVGYICYECKSDFKEFLASSNIFELDETEFIEELKIFINTPKGEYNGTKFDIDELFRKYEQ